MAFKLVLESTSFNVIFGHKKKKDSMVGSSICLMNRPSQKYRDVQVQEARLVTTVLSFAFTSVSKKKRKGPSLTLGTSADSFGCEN